MDARAVNRPAQESSMTSTDHESLMALIEAHKGILYKVANAYCKNPEDRGDLIQEILIQLWLSFKRFDPRTKFSTWMYRIALNVAISRYRSERRRIHDAVSMDELGFEVSVADQMLSEAGDDIRLLRELIEQLDEMNRALVLLYLDGYSHDEIAGILGITATNVATRINRIKGRWQNEVASKVA
jgi:RNA polymerase sigma-70 factor (ECF subfamily)